MGTVDPDPMAEYQILKPPPHPHRGRWTTLGVVVLLAAVGGGAYLIGHHRGHSSGGQAGTGSGSAASTTVPAVKALTVVSTTPANGTAQVPSDQPLSVQLSSPVLAGSAMPTLTPPVAGTWKKTGPATLTFVAQAPLIPTATETLTVPAGPDGLRAADGSVLAAPVTATFTVAQASTERLQQLLAELNYLPLSFAAAQPLSAPNQMLNPQDGNFTWRWPNTPASLTALWTEGSENVITKGAVMSFESQNGLTVDGLAGQQVWATLVANVASNKINANPYTYVFVSKQLPEALTLFENGAPIMANVAVNTGAPGADTTDGTYPVFEHVVNSRMQGTNPDGTTYDDPAVPWASFFNGGDALHGFVRSTYGSPQSNGCVEMPIAVAAQVWPLTPIGTLVTVVGPAS